MSIETTANRISYTGNGSTTAFSFPYKFLANGDLKVYIRTTSTGVETLKTITTHYTVAGAGEDAGGTVTMLTAPTAGESLIIINDPSPTQGVDLRENDSLPAEEVETALDRVTILAQRLKDQVTRSVRLSEGFTPTFDPTLPGDLDDAAGKIPLINEDGDGFAPASGWPNTTGVTAGMAAALAAAEAAQAAAEAAQAAAETAETNAETAETNAETAETNAEAAEVAAEASAAAAAASALAAANSAAATIWRDVVFLTFADSPYTVTNSQRAKLLCVDTSGGAVSITLPAIASLDLTSPFVVGIKKTSGDGNAVTINRSSTDTIDGATSKSITVADAGTALIPDTDTSPDEWTSADFGSSAGNLTVDRFSGDGSDTTFTLSVDPGSENNTFVYVEGIYQQKDTYSISGTTLTFSEAPPLGTNNIEVVIGTTLSIGTPSDGTVSRAKIIDGAVTPVKTTYVPPSVQIFTSGSGTYNKNYTFLISSGSATVGATYTNNGITYTVHATVSGATQVVMRGSGAPTASGTLTKASGTGDSTLTFSESIAPRYLRVEGVGGGGGGGGATSAANACGGGGSSGAYFRSIIANPSDTYSYGVGAAGAAGGLGNNPGGGGGSTTFGSITATGGGGGSGSNGTVGTPGSIGTSTGADINVSGGYGGTGIYGDGGDGFGGFGGASFFGGGGNGGTVGLNPANGVAYGSGGGAGAERGAVGQAGATGAPGIIIVEEHYA